MKKVITFGTFDNFHAGHESYLRQARALGDYLVVVVALDETVQKVKGRTPAVKEGKRKKDVEKSGIADKVIIGNATDKYKAIKSIRPSVIALGYDQFVFTYRLEKILIDEKIDAKIVRMNPYRPTVFKSSIIKKEEAHIPQLL